MLSVVLQPPPPLSFLAREKYEYWANFFVKFVVGNFDPLPPNQNSVTEVHSDFMSFYKVSTEIDAPPPLLSTTVLYD